MYYASRNERQKSASQKNHAKENPLEKKHPKPHGKHSHPKGRGLELVGSPDELLKKIFTDTVERRWATDQIVNEGPDHKQVHSALLLKTVSRLVKEVEKKTGTRFELQTGSKVSAAKHDHEAAVSVFIPSASIAEPGKDEIIETLSHSPAHELLAFSTLLQAMEWSIEALSNPPVKGLK